MIPHIPDKPFDGPLRLIVRWCFPATGKHHDGEYKYTKPDTDDLNKALKDIMKSSGRTYQVYTFDWRNWNEKRRRSQASRS